jgi:hypothetical protein
VKELGVGSELEATDSWTWAEQASCRFADPAMFDDEFDERTSAGGRAQHRETIRQARAICLACPALVACWDHVVSEERGTGQRDPEIIDNRSEAGAPEDTDREDHRDGSVHQQALFTIRAGLTAPEREQVYRRGRRAIAAYGSRVELIARGGEPVDRRRVSETEMWALLESLDRLPELIAMAERSAGPRSSRWSDAPRSRGSSGSSIQWRVAPQLIEAERALRACAGHGHAGAPASGADWSAVARGLQETLIRGDGDQARRLSRALGVLMDVADPQRVVDRQAKARLARCLHEESVNCAWLPMGELVALLGRLTRTPPSPAAIRQWVVRGKVRKGQQDGVVVYSVADAVMRVSRGAGMSLRHYCQDGQSENAL